MACTFCKIVSKEIPAHIVYEDKFTIAMLDQAPLTEGHTLVIPKKHYVNIYDITEEELKRVVVIAKNLADLYKHALNADGVNLIHSSNEAAGQSEFHYHMHIIPRYKSDGIKMFFHNERHREFDNAVILSKIKSAMGQI